MEETGEPSSTEGVTGTGTTRPSVKLFLGGLSWKTTEEEIRDHFSQYGEVTEVIVMRDRITGRPRGFGFVTFRDEAVADKVVEEAVHTLDGRQIDAKWSVPVHEKPKIRKIFVGGLAPETTEEQFAEYFRQFGNVAEAQIMQDHTSGRSRGFGFITFQEEDAVDRVFTAGTMHEINGKRVEVKTATPKGTGSLRLQQQQQAAALAVAGGTAIGTPARGPMGGPVMVPSMIPARPGGPYGTPYAPQLAAAGYIPGYAPMGPFGGPLPGYPYAYGPYSPAPMMQPYYYEGPAAGSAAGAQEGAAPGGQATSSAQPAVPVPIPVPIPGALPQGGGLYGSLGPPRGPSPGQGPSAGSQRQRPSH
jgi:heterogeneous nuclear ribonucleoprotein A1/A3